MTDRMLRRPAVEEMTGLSRSTIYDMINRGDFPRPIRIGRRAVAWRQASVQRWLEERFGPEAA